MRSRLATDQVAYHHNVVHHITNNPVTPRQIASLIKTMAYDIYSYQHHIINKVKSNHNKSPQNTASLRNTSSHHHHVKPRDRTTSKTKTSHQTKAPTAAQQCVRTIRRSHQSTQTNNHPTPSCIHSHHTTPPYHNAHSTPHQTA